MEIQREYSGENAIQSYDNNHIKIADNIYDHSVLVSRNKIIPEWTVNSVNDLDEASINQIIELKPKIIILGSNDSRNLLSPVVMQKLYKFQIGIEHMPIGGACRTFNILLGENRDVVGGFIITPGI